MLTFGRFFLSTPISHPVYIIDLFHIRSMSFVPFPFPFHPLMGGYFRKNLRFQTIFLIIESAAVWQKTFEELATWELNEQSDAHRVVWTAPSKQNGWLLYNCWRESWRPVLYWRFCHMGLKSVLEAIESWRVCRGFMQNNKKSWRSERQEKIIFDFLFLIVKT